MDLYGQEAEADLLADFITVLEHTVVVDVGAERGAFAEVMLRAGSAAVYLIEPEPANAVFLREKLGGDDRVTVHECAVSDRDRQLRLRLAVTPDGLPLTFGHSVLKRPDTDEIVWAEEILVEARSLGSLVDSGEIPARVGVLKIDTEGHDLQVVSGMGSLDPDVVMVEHWSDLPHSLGPCPWNTEDMLRALRPRGFSRFAFVVHRGEFVVLRWNDATVPTGAMGNLIFVHDRVLTSLLPFILGSTSAAAETVVELAEAEATAARERLEIIDRIAAERESLARDRTSIRRQRKHLVDANTAVADATAALEERRRLVEAREESLLRQREQLAHANALLEDARASLEESRRAVEAQPNRGLRRLRARVRASLRPKIGILHQHAPKPLLVPAEYLSAPPPSPAPVVSIVTPSFEQGRFLGRTIHSVLAQDYPALEYIIQDGGSSDETLEVIGSYEHMLTRWASEPDNGQADAINRGFRSSTGQIMAWLNSDDLLLPGAVAYVARYLAEHPNVDVVYGNRLMIDEDDRQIGAWILPAHDDKVLSYADYVPQETLFWRRSIWDEVGGSVDPTFAYALDWDLLLRFQAAGATMVRLPRFLGAFRIHEQQKTTAEAHVGADECALLRLRVHGREISAKEMRQQMRPFFIRHVLAHKRQRVVDRLPVRRVVVRTWVAQPVGHVPMLETAASIADGLARGQVEAP